jgi:hypothetical protein
MPSRLPELDAIRDKVEREWENDKRISLREAFYEQMEDLYQVTVEMPDVDTPAP